MSSSDRSAAFSDAPQAEPLHFVRHHVVQFSTGLASAEVLKRVAETHRKGVVALSADTLVEDDDWRFARAVIRDLQVPWVVLADGRTPMQVGRDERVVPNNRLAVCSRILKRQLLRGYIESHYDPAETMIYLGYDWTEPHRFEAARKPWQPYQIAAPLMEPPYVEKSALYAEWEARGIKPPSLYEDGFAHANCGGGCVRSGQAQWKLLLEKRPNVYAEWESEEERSRAELGKDVAILRDRRGGTTKPLTLKSFRERLQGDSTLFDPNDWGACNCMGESDQESPPDKAWKHSLACSWFNGEGCTCKETS